MRGAYAKVAARNRRAARARPGAQGRPSILGYRRVWAYLRYVDRCRLTKSASYGVMKANDLLVKPEPEAAGPGAKRAPGSQGRVGPTNGGAST